MHEAARDAAARDEGDVRALAEVAREAITFERGGAMLLATDLLVGPWDRRSEPSSHLVVGTIDDVVVGYGELGLLVLDGPRRIGVVREIFVLPDARGVGVGEAIMDRLIDAARAERCAALDARALPGDRGTKNFFERYGLAARLLIVHRRLDPTD